MIKLILSILAWVAAPFLITEGLYFILKDKKNNQKGLMLIWLGLMILTTLIVFALNS